MKFLWYEDLKKGLIPVIKDLSSNFLGYHLTELKILQIDDFLHIDNYRKFRAENPVKSEMAGKFFRKGQVGDWKNHFSGGRLQVWNKWIEEALSGTDIQLQF
jgi:hypothetical protein